jgi:hypothetical protein
VGYENETNEQGERLIWLDHAVVARLRPCVDRGELQRRHSAAGGHYRRAAMKAWITSFRDRAEMRGPFLLRGGRRVEPLA